MLRVVVTDMQAYDRFYKRMIGAIPLKNVTSRFAMERVKATTVLPIPADGAGEEARPEAAVRTAHGPRAGS